MKKPIRLMQFVLAGLVIVAATQAVSAQGRDFAGSWTLDVEKSGSKDGPPVVVITQTAKEFTARFGGEKAQLMPFNLDGTERTIKERGATTRAVWNGDKLEASVKMPTEAGREGNPGPEVVTFSREGAWLVLEAKGTSHAPQKLYFKKAPAK